MRIPKVIHHVWVGPAPLPERARHYIGTWRSRHPDWEMRLWADGNLPPLRNRALYDSFTGLGPRSDILRYEPMHRFGGVYADVDVECLRPLGLLVRDATAFVGRIAPRQVESGVQGIEIAVLGSAPGHPFFDQVLAHLPVWAQAFRPFTSSLSTGPQFLERQVALWEHRKAAGAPGTEAGLTLLPADCFYPFTWEGGPRAAADPEATQYSEGTYAVHHWWGTWHTDAAEQVGPVATLLSDRLCPRYRQFIAGLFPADRAAAEAVLLDECRSQSANANDFYRLAAAKALEDLPHAEARTLLARLARDRNGAVAAAARGALLPLPDTG